MSRKLAPIADRVVKRLPDCRACDEWEATLLDVIDFSGGDELDFTQQGLVFDMVVARWDKARHPSPASAPTRE